MTSRHAVHRLSSSDVTSCVTSYLQLVLVAKEMGWLAPTQLGLSDVNPAVAIWLIGTQHPLFWRHKQLPPRKGESGSDFFQSTTYISYITKRVWTNFQIVSNLVLHTAIKAWLFGLGAMKTWKWVFLFQSFNWNCYVNNANFMSPLRVVSGCSKGIAIMTLPHDPYS